MMLYVLMASSLLALTMLLLLIVLVSSRNKTTTSKKSDTHWITLGLGLGISIGLGLGLLFSLQKNNFEHTLFLGPMIGIGLGLFFGIILRMRYGTQTIFNRTEKGLLIFSIVLGIIMLAIGVTAAPGWFLL